MVKRDILQEKRPWFTGLQKDRVLDIAEVSREQQLKLAAWHSHRRQYLDLT